MMRRERRQKAKVQSSFQKLVFWAILLPFAFSFLLDYPLRSKTLKLPLPPGRYDSLKKIRERAADVSPFKGFPLNMGLPGVLPRVQYSDSRCLPGYSILQAQSNIGIIAEQNAGQSPDTAVFSVDVINTGV